MSGDDRRTSIWVEAVGPVDRHARLLAAGLGRLGVDAAPPDPAGPAGPGVVLFDEPGRAVADRLREVSRQGTGRVLALGCCGPADGWELLRAGAADVLGWDQTPDPAAAVAARVGRWAEVDAVVRSPLVRDNLVGASPAWVAAVRQVVEAATASDGPILITGESGTGKELAARLVHTLAGRPGNADLVVVDCTTVHPELSGSEFFGHEKGAFTGAAAARDGAFALADGGTLFLDEVGELPPPLQAELLRVVQEGTYKRVGSNEWRRARFRLVSATNRDLLAEEAAGRFRRDLYFRLAGWVVHLPPLRDRADDVLPLARHFLRQHRSGDPIDLSPDVADFLLRRAYPGNVRDLRQLMYRIAHRHVGPGPVTAGSVPPDERPGGPPAADDWVGGPLEDAVRRALGLGVGLKEIGRAAEAAAVRIAVGGEGGNLQRAAVRLGVTDRALQLRRAAVRPNGNGHGEVLAAAED
jgi:transcriptional regulator with GAF, ATPase, and Fis domain